MRWLPVLMLALVGLSGCGSDPTTPGVENGTDAQPDPARKELTLVEVADGLQKPLLVTHDGSRIFIVEQGGKVKLLGGGTYLDISSQVSSGSEQGLLGIAFDPADATRLFVSYTANNGDSVLERWSAGPTMATRGAELLRVAQPAANHNGGHIAFGPDGMLYYGLGDGGLRDDAYQNGQNKGTLLGTILRLDVSGNGYTIPPDNPFVGEPASRPEIWHWGLRNPWRFSFDTTGAMWIGDVGQDAWEEVDHAEPGQGGINWGWPAYEGSHQYRGLALQHELPIAEYANQGNDCSITGGHVGRDPSVPELMDAYVFADYCSGKIWTLRPDGAGWTVALLMDTEYFISSFGEDLQGRLYVVNHNGGAVYRFE